MKHWYRAHGLGICSELELAMQPGAPAVVLPDLVVQHGPGRAIPADHPPGDQLAWPNTPDGTLRYSLCRDRDQAVLRYPGLCDFVGDRTWQT